MSICLVVSSIVGIFCQLDAAPIGTCYDTGDWTLCQTEAEILQVRASWYNPLLGGTNCQEPCEFLGDMTPVDECWNECIACPLGWYGNMLDFYHDTVYIGRYQCRDHGGAIKPHYGRIYLPEVGFTEKWFIYADFLYKQEPYFAYNLLDWRFYDGIKHTRGSGGGIAAIDRKWR